jgi:hypothetical protein
VTKIYIWWSEWHLSELWQWHRCSRKSSKIHRQLCTATYCKTNKPVCQTIHYSLSQTEAKIKGVGLGTCQRKQNKDLYWIIATTRNHVKSSPFLTISEQRLPQYTHQNKTFVLLNCCFCGKGAWGRNNTFPPNKAVSAHENVTNSVKAALCMFGISQYTPARILCIEIHIHRGANIFMKCFRTSEWPTRQWLLPLPK